MRKASADSKVKKTLVRHAEQKVNISKHKVIRDPGAGSSKSSIHNIVTTQELAHPTLCSSEVLANYLSEVKKSAPPRLLHEEFQVDKAALSAKVTRKLNFHFNDRIYNNLVELNADAADLKKKDRQTKITTIKKDLEPNIDDFCHNEKAKDVIPIIPIIKPKLKPLKCVDTGKLHKLVAMFEVL
ncbi:uncharacterized protein LOC125060807 [Pieris napi]|uniref:uncharacterized protein LOC125060807 n=1 Tax=Pieris napi TaxID=78633 RepID=UPI001FBB88BF|nr:uncharacterized protein LOC125060807 [Pieris napi]